MLPQGKLADLLERYESPDGVFCAFRNREPALMNLLTAAELRKLLAYSSDVVLRRMDEAMIHHEIRAFSIMDPCYPALLQEIPDPPAVLFYQGKISCLSEKKVCIVGSRAASYNGKKATAVIARRLSDAGVCIVSGMAGGIDSAAHTGCLDGASPTIAVAGCGLDRVYPQGNLPLRDRILRNNGLILSEYAPGEAPIGWHFPARNRIMTGLSTALVLMEAQSRSGSMTSVRLALDQGREVFVYPGDPSSPHFEGNHILLREGARFFTSAADILEDLGWLDNPPVMGQNNLCASGMSGATREEQSVLDVLGAGPLGFEALLQATGMDSPALLSTITLLQLRGFVELLPGKMYQLK